MGAHVPRLGDVDLQSTWGGFDFLRFHKLHWKVWSNTIIKFEHKNGVCDIAQRQKSALAERERSMVRFHLSQQIAEEWNGAVTMGGRYRCFCPGLPNHNRLITYWYWVRLPFPLLIEKSGYKFYIIKDLGKYNKEFVEREFEIFKKMAS